MPVTVPITFIIDGINYVFQAFRGPSYTFLINSTGLIVAEGGDAPVYTYEGSDVFLGFSNTEGAITPDEGSAVGDTIDVEVSGPVQFYLGYTVTITQKEQFESEMTALADTINAKAGTSGQMTIAQMKTAVDGIAVGASLNIAYGSTAPSDTSKLWIEGDEPNNVEITPNIDGAETMTAGIASLPTATNGIGTAAVGTKVYLFGGYYGSLNTINVFDTTTDTIATLSATLPTGAFNIAAAAVGTKIYLFGGNNSGNRLNTIMVFDTTTNTITTLSTTLPSPSYNIAAAAVGTKIYLFGGNIGVRKNTIMVFDTTTNTITTLSATLPSVADSIGAAAVGTKVYLFGGTADNRLDTINVFDTTTNTITTLSTTLPIATLGIGAAAVGTNIYLFGGSFASGDAAILLNTINVFDTTTNTITTLSTTLPIGASRIGTAAVGTKIYLFGGDATYSINLFTVSVTLSSGDIIVQTNGVTNEWTMISTDSFTVTEKVIKVYRGNSEDTAEEENAYLYQNGAWAQVSGN